MESEQAVCRRVSLLTSSSSIEKEHRAEQYGLDDTSLGLSCAE